MTINARRRAAVASGLITAALLSACGGGDNSASTNAQVQAASTTDAVRTTATLLAASNSQLVSRFLTQATFGPKPGEADMLASDGFANWITQQMAKPSFSHTAAWDSLDAAYKARDPASYARPIDVLNGFWKAALTADDQLRQRVAFALSEIFVVSLRDNAYDLYPRSRMVASFMDTLAANAFGNYRNLLEAVALHPAMGVYLSHLHNQKEDPLTGRVPDENFAREVMQLFSIGLHELNADGSTKKGGDGNAIETYGSADIAGLAKVFTGFSWNCGTGTDTCFLNGTPTSQADKARTSLSMAPYSKFHSASAKSFLNANIAAGSSDPNADLKVALDALFNHPNVGPFIGKQLIQRLVTSNPSAAYVGRVAAAFANNGKGVRGDMAAVVSAVLLDTEARSAANIDSSTFGKVREPVLRLTAFLRAFGATSDSGQYRVGNTEDAGTALSQSPLRAPSVFNFYRPGYVPPNTETGTAGLVAPEMQIAHEASISGYVNFMISMLSFGVGEVPSGGTRRDVQINWTPALAVASSPTQLATLMSDRLMYGQMSAALKSNVVAAVTSIAMPIANATNTATVNAAKLRRAQIAAAITLASPEFLVQR